MQSIVSNDHSNICTALAAHGRVNTLMDTLSIGVGWIPVAKHVLLGSVNFSFSISAVHPQTVVLLFGKERIL